MRDTFCSYGAMELCTRSLGLQTEALKVRPGRTRLPPPSALAGPGGADSRLHLQARGLDLSRVRTCAVVAEERPRTALTQSFSKLFKDLGLQPRAVSTSFGCRVNLAVCLQVGSAGFGPVPDAAGLGTTSRTFPRSLVCGRTEAELLTSALVGAVLVLESADRPAGVCGGWRRATVGQNRRRKPFGAAVCWALWGSRTSDGFFSSSQTISHPRMCPPPLLQRHLFPSGRFFFFYFGLMGILNWTEQFGPTNVPRKPPEVAAESAPTRLEPLASARRRRL